MRKIYLWLILIPTLASISIPMVRAELAGEYFYYLLPPSSSFSLNDEILSNDLSKEGKMIFQYEDKELLRIPAKTSGFKVISKNFRTDVKPETALSVMGSVIELQAGSVHVISSSRDVGEQKLLIGNLILSFQSANFLVYASGDQSQKIVKVLEGELQIENPLSNQKATLKAQQMTNADNQGRLLIPFPFDPNDLRRWWESDGFNYTFAKLPISNAGEDQRVLGNMPVVLDGSESDFVTGDIFEWRFVKGPKDAQGRLISEVVFNSTYIQKPLFTPIIDGEYHFSLQITDQQGGKSNHDQVVIYVGKQYLKPLAVFPDVPTDHPNNLAITYLYKKNVMRGSQDTKTGQVLFRPEDTINRVEILKALFENKRQKLPSPEELKSLPPETLFFDVKLEHWFAPYVYLGKKMGIIKGNNGLYRPADKVLMVEALKMLVEGNQIDLVSFRSLTGKPYLDSEADAWYTPYLFFAKAYNLVDVDIQGHITPGQALTRAKFAEIVYRMESINLLEKRSILEGFLRDSKTKQGIPAGEIFVYNALVEASSGVDDGTGFVRKGDLYLKTKTKNDGSFSISLPILTKYYIEAISGDKVSKTRVVVDLKENIPTTIELTLDQ
jgi:hypothetical protein